MGFHVFHNILIFWASCSVFFQLVTNNTECFDRPALRKEAKGESKFRIQIGAMNPDAVATAFVEHYYSTFDSNRAGLANLYQENSMLSFEGVKIQGAQHIVAKLTSLPFQQCKHQINTVDCQPSGPIGGMLVFVSGNLQLPGEEHVLKFSQMFHLMPTQQGSFYVMNDIFRLNYA